MRLNRTLPRHDSVIWAERAPHGFGWRVVNDDGVLLDFIRAVSVADGIALQMLLKGNT